MTKDIYQVLLIMILFALFLFGSTARADAIMRHGGEAGAVTNKFFRLSSQERLSVITFLTSL